jgi:hypothetical protein
VRFLEPQWFSAVGAFVSTGRDAFSSACYAAPSMPSYSYNGCLFDLFALVFFVESQTERMLIL